mmetsp:Transcript_62776/g.149794  ORF Transcript_62776/g.149794 Transcript_62776/m.149794 type:complete len:207 (-) Transcript_62776:90-710(-)
MPGFHGAGCGCRAEDDFIGVATELLLPWIDVDGVTGLNEDVENSSKGVFRPYDLRLDDTKFVETPEGDAELLIKVPFTAPIKLTAITVIGGENGTVPARVALHANREELDFSTVGDAQPQQELELAEDFHGAIQYPVRAGRFSNITHLSLYFPTSIGEEQTRIHWIGLWGVGSSHKRQAVVTVYEAIPNASEKMTKDDVGGTADVA